jgi:hypothetical protein
MAKRDVERDFPLLRDAVYHLSDPDFNNNCLGYALGDLKNWWEPPHGNGQYWPPGFEEDVTVDTVEAIIRLHGFTEEIDPSETPAVGAIAIYAKGGEWTHFACFRDGEWKSKLGEGNDVEGIILEHLEVRMYGTVFKVLSRPKKNL